VVATLGIVVTERRARYQHVHTLESHRRRGIASRLVVEAASLSSAAHEIDHFVIVADPDYHAIGIYESVGFEPVETVCCAAADPAQRARLNSDGRPRDECPEAEIRPQARSGAPRLVSNL
jgi:hypothetical protein